MLICTYGWRTISVICLIVYGSNCVQLSTAAPSQVKLDQILVTGEKPILFMEQDVTWDYRKHENWRVVFVFLKPKLTSLSTTITFGGYSYPFWFRSIDKCLRWSNYYDSNQIVQLIEPNSTIKYIPTETMNQLYSACDLSERLKVSSPLPPLINLQLSPTIGQSNETEKETINRLLFEKSKQSPRVLIQFHYKEHDINDAAKPLEGVIVHLINGKGSQLTSNQSTIELQIDYCRLYDSTNLAKYSTIYPNIPTIHLESNSIQTVTNICKDTMDTGFDSSIKLFEHTKVGRKQLSEINFLEVDNNSWRSRGTRNFFIRVYTIRGPPRSPLWFKNKPDYLPFDTLNLDHCEIYSHPDLVDLMLTETTETFPINYDNQLIDRPLIKLLLHFCDYVNVYRDSDQ